LLGTEKSVKGNEKNQVSPIICRRTSEHKKTIKKGANTAAKMFSRNEYFKTTEIRFLLACNQTVHFIYVFAK
jgi:hypothetical protein